MRDLGNKDGARLPRVIASALQRARRVAPTRETRSAKEGPSETEVALV